MAQALLEDARGVQLFVVDDGVEHAHAAFIEDAHDRLAMLQIFGERGAEFRAFGGQLASVQRMHVRGIVADRSVAQPLRQPVQEILVRELLAPDRREFLAGLDQRPVEVEQADESGPLSGPVGDCQNRPAMAEQAGQNMVRVLPRGRGEYESGVWMDLHEDVHPHALRRDEAVLFRLVIGMGAEQLEALPGEGSGQLLFHLPLRGPALPVGAKPQIAAGDEQYFICRRFYRFIAPHRHFVFS